MTSIGLRFLVAAVVLTGCNSLIGVEELRYERPKRDPESTGGWGGQPGSDGGGGSTSTSGGGGDHRGAGASGGAGMHASGGGGSSPGGGGGGAAPCTEPGSGSVWAEWRMPNPAGFGLPNVASYDPQDDGTIVDSVTMLTWQKEESDYLSLSGAAAYCEDLTEGGHCDWRLPSRIELLSLVDASRSYPSIDLDVFPSTPSVGSYWSSSPVAGSEGKQWYVHFGLGQPEVGGSANSGLAKCVRGPTDSSGNYVAHADTVFDERTGLHWERNPADAIYTFTEASAHCETLSLSGHGFRAPSVKELWTLVDESASSPAIDTIRFPGTTSAMYWTSTVSEYDPYQAWMVLFDTGFSQPASTGGKNRVRCVR